MRARSKALSGSGDGGHGKMSRSRVDRGVRGTMDEIGKAFKDCAVAAGEVVALSGKIGRESRFKCRPVHLPAAFAEGAGW